MPEHQKVQKKSKKDTEQSGQKKKYAKKESSAAQEDTRNIMKVNDRNEERFRQLSDKVDKNKMVDAEMAAEIQGCRQEKQKEAATLRLRETVA